MGEFSWRDFFSFLWLNLKDHIRKGRKPYTTRCDKRTAEYRAERKKRNKAALASRKINRRRAK